MNVNVSSELKPGKSSGLILKEDLASALKCSPRYIELLMRRKMIPYVKLGKKFVRFRLEAVLRALQKHETIEVGRDSQG